MKDFLAKILFAGAAGLMALASAGLVWKIEPFHTHFFLFAWWCAILTADAWLYMSAGESVFLANMADFVTFLLPLSAVTWFMFEMVNLRLNNWAYVGLPKLIWVRWPGYVLAFSTVIPGIFVTGGLLEFFGLFRKNEFSRFFAQDFPRPWFAASLIMGTLGLALPLIWPKLFFPLVWVAFIFLLDPLNARMGRASLIQEWRQGNWNRTLQLLLAGLVCGLLWEFWNYKSGAKWLYTVPLPAALRPDLKVFEMPLLGFLGFPPFALECFVMAEFARGLREKLPREGWRSLGLAAILFSLWMCKMVDLHSVRSFK